MIESASIGALQIHRTGSLAVSSWASTVAPRTVRSPRPRSHGEADRSSLVAGRRFSLTGYARGATPLAAQEALDGLVAALNPPRKAALVWRREGDAADLTAEVVIDSEIDAPLAGSRKTIQWGLALFAGDPRMYSVIEQTEAEDPIVAAPGALTAVNGGTFPTPPRIRVDGPTNTGGLTISNTTTGQDFVLLSAILLTGDHLIVDMHERTITGEIDGAPFGPTFAALDPAPSDWWQLAPGSNALALSGAAVAPGDTSWSVTWRDARI